MQAFDVVNRLTDEVVGTIYLTDDGDFVRFEPLPEDEPVPESEEDGDKARLGKLQMTHYLGYE
jgi:hypothetical protein